MKNDITKNIVEYMNVLSNKEFSYEEVKAIATAIYREKVDRKAKEIVINTRTPKGKDMLNQRIARFANKLLKGNSIKSDHVHLYRICRMEEFTDRTGKCAWGFKNVRRQRGFDEITGMELDFN